MSYSISEYYEMSDDGSVYRQGQEAEKELQILAGTSHTHKKMYQDFKEHYFSGDAWGTKKTKFPELKDYEEAV